MEISFGAIDDLGVGRRARESELATLDRDGFVVVPALLGEADLATLRLEFERLVEKDPGSRRHELGNRRTKAPRDNAGFAVCWCHRVVLDAAAHLLGPTFQVGDVDLRDPEPGGGVQRLHPDHGDVPVPGITATWFLDAFTPQNGATRMLPRSHVEPPRASPVPIPGAEVPMEGEVVAIGPAGSLLVRDARLYHAGGRNSTKAMRRSAPVFFQHDIPEPASDPDAVSG
jgi:hypothetical protein